MKLSKVREVQESEKPGVHAVGLSRCVKLSWVQEVWKSEKPGVCF